MLTKAVTGALLTLIGDLICQVQFSLVPLMDRFPDVLIGFSLC